MCVEWAEQSDLPQFLLLPQRDASIECVKVRGGAQCKDVSVDLQWCLKRLTLKGRWHWAQSVWLAKGGGVNHLLIAYCASCNATKRHQGGGVGVIDRRRSAYAGESISE